MVYLPMPRSTEPLSDLKIRKTLPGKKAIYLFDGGGLYLLVKSSGGKLWRLKYRFQGKDCLLSLGEYPTVSLAMAREKRDEMKTSLAGGTDPSFQRKLEKTFQTDGDPRTFEFVAREWFEKHSPSMAKSHSSRIIRRLEKDVFPWLGKKLVTEITPPEILIVLRRIEDRGAVDTTHRAMNEISRIIRYAIATGRATSDPTRDLRGAIPPAKEDHLAAIIDPVKLGVLMKAIHGYQGGIVVRSALRLAPLLVVRPGELRQAEWEHINLDLAEWRFAVTKTKSLHIVPLPRQAVEILRDLNPLTGHGRYVFPNPKTPNGSRPMSENGVLVALRTLGFSKDEMTGHGFRAAFRTIGDEVLGFRVDFMEHQLAHAVKDPLGRAYNRTSFLPERKAMMQKWADYLDELARGR
jgi:integrase